MVEVAAVRTQQLTVISQTIPMTPEFVHCGIRNASGMRSSDTIARLGGDEFVILAGSANPDYAAQLAQKILEQLRLPILVASQSISISGSLGIAGSSRSAKACPIAGPTEALVPGTRSS